MESHYLSDDFGEHCELVMCLRCSIERRTIGVGISLRMHELCSVDICEFLSLAVNVGCIRELLTSYLVLKNIILVKYVVYY